MIDWAWTTEGFDCWQGPFASRRDALEDARRMGYQIVDVGPLVDGEIADPERVVIWDSDER